MTSLNNKAPVDQINRTIYNSEFNLQKNLICFLNFLVELFIKKVLHISKEHMIVTSGININLIFHAMLSNHVFTNHVFIMKNKYKY